jgi:hypothetical protein
MFVLSVNHAYLDGRRITVTALRRVPIANTLFFMQSAMATTSVDLQAAQKELAELSGRVGQVRYRF